MWLSASRMGSAVSVPVWMWRSAPSTSAMFDSMPRCWSSRSPRRLHQLADASGRLSLHLGPERLPIDRLRQLRTALPPLLFPPDEEIQLVIEPQQLVLRELLQ